MQKVIIDTNVLVSALIQKSYPFLIINDLFIEKKIILCVSDEMIEEYYDVLNRPKFSKYPRFIIEAKSLMADILIQSKKFNPSVKLSLIKDKSDNKLLELADESNSSFIITGNTNDFVIKRYKKTKIVTPKEYWEKYKP